MAVIFRLRIRVKEESSRKRITRDEQRKEPIPNPISNRKDAEAIRKDPSDDQFRSEILVCVVQATTCVLFGFLVWHQSLLDDFFEFTVNVGLR